MIRSASSLYDVSNGQLVLAAGSPCPAPQAEIGGSADAAKDSTPDSIDSVETTTVTDVSTVSATTTEPSDTCASVGIALDRLARYGFDDVVASSSELAAIVRVMRTAIREARTAVRADMETVAGVVDVFADQLAALEDRRPTADASTTAVIDELTEALARYVRLIPGREVLAEWAPEFAADCELMSVGARMNRAWYEFDEALAAFLETDLADDPAFAPLVEMSTSPEEADRGKTALSTMVADFDECRETFTAQDLGDNDGCDALYHACDERDLLACNDLYFSTLAGSPYSAFAASCGNRVRVGDYGFGGYCEELDR